MAWVGEEKRALQKKSLITFCKVTEGLSYVFESRECFEIEYRNLSKSLHDSVWNFCLSLLLLSGNSALAKHASLLHEGGNRT
jgi:hypothetical protein